MTNATSIPEALGYKTSHLVTQSASKSELRNKDIQPLASNYSNSRPAETTKYTRVDSSDIKGFSFVNAPGQQKGKQAENNALNLDIHKNRGVLKPARKTKRYRVIEALKSRNVDYRTNKLLNDKLRQYLQANLQSLGAAGSCAPIKWAERNEELRVKSLQGVPDSALRRGTASATEHHRSLQITLDD